MQLMPADIHYLTMTAHTGTVIRPQLLMWFMTFITIKLHGCIFWDINLYSLLYQLFRGPEILHIKRVVSYKLHSYRAVPVTEEAFLSSRFEILGSVSMAVQTGELLHPRTMHLFPLVTPETEPRRSNKFMGDISVTLCTFDLLHKVMLCMPGRTINKRGVGISLVLIPVTFNTVLPRHDNLSMALRHRLRPVEYESNKQLVLFGNCEMMTLVTVYACMLALLPGIICGLHKMTTDTELRVVLGKVIKLEGYNSSPDNYHKRKYGNDNSALQRQAFSDPAKTFQNFLLTNSPPSPGIQVPRSQGKI